MTYIAVPVARRTVYACLAFGFYPTPRVLFTMPFGLEISRDLVHQLQEENGIAPQRAPGGGSAGPSMTPHVRKLDSATRAEIQKHRKLEAVLKTSRNVGGVLLKHEEDEVAKAREFAAQVVQEAPKQCLDACSSERDACIQCYRRHKGDEMQCASAVSAYDTCARESLLSRPAVSQ